MAKILKIQNLASFLSGIGISEAESLKAVSALDSLKSETKAKEIPAEIVARAETLKSEMDSETLRTLARLLAPRAKNGSAPKTLRIPARVRTADGTVIPSGRPGRPGDPVNVADVPAEVVALILAPDSGVSAAFRAAFTGAAPVAASLPNGPENAPESKRSK